MDLGKLEIEELMEMYKSNWKLREIGRVMEIKKEMEKRGWELKGNKWVK